MARLDGRHEASLYFFCMFSKLHLQGRLLDLIVKFISAASRYGYYFLIKLEKVSLYLARKKLWEVHLGV